MVNRLVVSIVIILLFSCYICTVKAATGEINQTATVSKVIDGDTFDIASGERIRLADVDTPERSETGYFEATDFLAGLVEGKTVYLDIDDLSRTDQYGRLICVVYVSYNSTHYENVNKALLVSNYAIVYDFHNNEFNPSTWQLYELKSNLSGYSSTSPNTQPTSTPILSPTPLRTQIPTQPPTSTINPQPSIPEFTSWTAALLIITLASVSILILKFTKQKADNI